MSVNQHEPYVMQDLIDRGHARRMDQVEDYFAILQRQKLYRNFNLYAELNRPITRGQLANALKSIIMRYSILASTVVPKRTPNHDLFYRSEEYYNSLYPECDYIKVLDRLELSGILLNDQRKHKEILDRIIEQFIEDDFEYTAKLMELIGTINIPYHHKERPNWRLLALPCKDEKYLTDKLVIISNHCSMDGISCVNLLQGLVDHISQNHSHAVSSELIYDYSADFAQISKLPSPLTSYIDYRPHNRELPGIVLTDLIKKYLNYESDDEMINTMEHNDVQTYHELVKLSPSEIAFIKNKIKSNVHAQCTLTPFFQACFVVALERYGGFFKKNYREWGFDVALIKNLRVLLPEDADLRDKMKYGCNIGGQHYSYLISSFDVRYEDRKKFWSLVKKYYDTIQNYPRGFLVSVGILMIDQIAEYKNIDKLIIDDYLNKKRGGVLCSNLGNHQQKKDQQYYITDMVFSQTPGSLRFAFGLNAVTTNTKGMNIDLSIARTVISSRNEWGVFCNEFRKIIRNFTEI